MENQTDIKLTQKEILIFSDFEYFIYKRSGVSKRSGGFGHLIITNDTDNILEIDAHVGVDGESDSLYAKLEYNRETEKFKEV